MLVIHEARMILSITICNFQVHKTCHKIHEESLDTVKGTDVPVHVIERVAEERHSILTSTVDVGE